MISKNLLLIFSLLIGLLLFYNCSDRNDGNGVNGGNAASNDADNDGIANNQDACPNTPAGITVDANGCPVSNNNNNSNIATTEAAQTLGNVFWWNETTFYELFIRSFYDSNDDGIGDINGLISKLDYLNDGNPATTTDLGISGIWLMPFYPAGSWHGYDIKDYKAIDSDYGTINDFKNLVTQCHARGIKVIIDFVNNHTSYQHPWFTNSANYTDNKRNWYRWETYNPGSGWHSKNGAYYYGLFWSGMPDLNYSHQPMKDEIKAIANWWLTNVNVDGLRLDAAKHIFELGTGGSPDHHKNYTWWEEFNTSYKAAKSDALTVGEIYSGSEEGHYYVLNKRLDLVFDFDLAGSIKDAVKNDNPGNTSAGLIQKMNYIKSLYPYHQYATFLSNHDQDRSYEVMGKINNDWTWASANAKLAAAVYLTLPGVPFIYYGEEIGLYGTGDHKYIRAPLPWADDATTAGFTTAATPWWTILRNDKDVSVAKDQADANSLWNWYRKMISLRNDYPSLTKGTYQGIGVNSENTGKIYTYLRDYNNKAVIAIHNFSKTNLGNIKLHASNTNLSAGTYNLTDLLSGSSLETISLNDSGGFQNLRINILNAKKSMFVQLAK